MTEDLPSPTTDLTAEVLRLNQRLREQDVLIEAIHMHSIVSIADPAGNIVDANASFSRISGYSQAELVGQNHRIVKSDSHSDEFWQSMWQTISAGYPWKGVVCNRAKDGSLYWVDTVITPAFGPTGHIEKYVSIRTDVTAVKLAQQHLERNNTLMHSILENIPVGLSAFDGELRLIAKNRLFLAHLDFPESLFQRSVTTFEDVIRFNAERGEYGDEDREASVQRIVERAHHPVPHQFERVRPNGSALEVRGAPIPGGGFVTTYADISDRKRAEAALSSTTQMLQSVLDAASEVAVVTIGLDRKITLFNKGAERMLGYGAAEAIGVAATDLYFDPDELQARAATLSAAVGRPVDGLDVTIDESSLGKKSEWTYIRKNGSRVVVTLVVTTLNDLRGTRIGYLGISYDISVEKDYESWLRRALDDAQAATLAKSQFLANMSHELRTPMNAILGMLRLLQNTDLTARQLDYAAKTEGAAKSLLGLLNDILDFSKMDAGKMELDLQPFRLDRMMRDLSVILSVTVGDKPVEVLFDIDSNTPKTLLADSMRLQQVLINLGSNAIKFTAEGQVVVQIRTLDQTPQQATLRIAVQDSGIGIAPENLGRIFEGFSQAEASTTRRFGGTGLGLTISRRLLALMGADLEVDSVLGEGSSFHFTLTLPIASDFAEDRAKPTLVGPLSVLVVDDNLMARELLAAMTSSFGWQVDVASTGEQALTLAQARAATQLGPYDAIFVDWAMPGMDGWETIRRMRLLAPVAQTPITVMVTAHGREMLTRRSAQEQARLDAFLVKPITAAMLYDAVAEARSGSTHHASGTRKKPSANGQLTGLRLLVVEDNLVNQQVANELLKAEGAQVELADNGLLALAAVANAAPPFDAVLMDIQMPVMDGYTATRAIRHELGMTSLPVIAMTANAMASDRAACLEAGMNDHVGKPFDLPHLIEVLLIQTGRIAASQSDAGVPVAGVAPLAEGNESGLPLPDAVEVEAAIERLGGDQELYLQIVDSFIDEIKTAPDQVDGLLAAGDLVAAVRLLHTIKGLSATVGACHLEAVSRASELRLKAPDAQSAGGTWRAEFRQAIGSAERVMRQVAADLTASGAA